MRSVGVLTFIHTMNYGAELQGLALKRAIESLGYPSEMISYENSSVARRESVRLPGMGDLIHPRRAVKMLMNYRANKVRRKGCDEFSSMQNQFGPSVASGEEIAELYEVVVVGSDQVWNPGLTDGDLTFFLASEKCKKMRKIAYAASFGDAFSLLGQGDTYRKAIEDFDAIGIREKSGARLLNDSIQGDVLSVLDPTLLICKEEWEILEEEPFCVGSKPFVFVYLVAEHEKALEHACRLARKKNLSVYAIDSFGLPKRGVTYVNDASPAHFLWYMRNASYVVTSSFHGVCFSLNYGKEFWYSLPDGTNRATSRIVDLLERLGIEGGEVDLDVGVDIAPARLNPENLKMQRASSLNFLSSALESVGKGK